jgi:hypothetical protein
MIFQFLKFTISYWKWYFNLKIMFSYLKWYWTKKSCNQNKTVKLFEILLFRGTESFVLIKSIQYHRLFQKLQNYHVVSLMIKFPATISYRIVDDKYLPKYIISYRWWYIPSGKSSYCIVSDNVMFKIIISYRWW